MPPPPLINLGNPNEVYARYFYLHLKGQVDTTKTKVGIKVPVGQTSSYPAFTSYVLGGTNRTGLGVQKVSVVGVTPSILSSTGWPSGFDRTAWTTAIESDHIVIYTSDATQKSSLSSSETYWFNIELRDSSNFFWLGTMSISTDENVGVSITDANLRTFGYSGFTYTGTFSTTVKEYNS